MEIIFIILPLALVMAGAAVAAFFWSVHRGQLDDLDTPQLRMLFNDDGDAAVTPGPARAPRG